MDLRIKQASKAHFFNNFEFEDHNSELKKGDKLVIEMPRVGEGSPPPFESKSPEK
jgi:hypothetical protein